MNPLIVFQLLNSKLGRFLGTLILLLGCWLWYSHWLDTQRSDAYKHGYDAAVLVQVAEAAKEITVDRETIKIKTKEIKEDAKAIEDVVQDALRESSTSVSTCTDVGAESLRLLNAPIEAGNSAL